MRFLESSIYIDKRAEKRTFFLLIGAKTKLTENWSILLVQASFPENEKFCHLRIA